MPYLLAAVALVAPVILVVQALRGRVRVQSCCSVPADQDLRLRTATPGSADAGVAADARTPERA